MGDVLDLDQINALCEKNVRGVMRYPKWRSPKPQEMAKALMRLYAAADKIGLAWALHPAHLAVFERTSGFMKIAEFRWHPHSDIVQLRGDLEDGYALEVKGAPNATVRLAILHPDAIDETWRMDDPDAELRALVPETVDYEVCGWSPEQGAWIYQRKEQGNG